MRAIEKRNIRLYNNRRNGAVSYGNAERGKFMDLYIGENIKRLRRERGITQETLAEYMNVSCPAVSKWERGETLPDVTMIIPLASYFGVSTDEILGLDAAKNEEKIRWYLAEKDRFTAVGKEKEKFDLVSKAYAEFPNDFRIIEQYLWQLVYDPYEIVDGHYNGVAMHRDELYRLCSRVLEECTLDSPRYAAMEILGNLYIADGEPDRALELCERFPNYCMAKEEQIENCYEDGSKAWWKQVRLNIRELADMLSHKIANAALRSGASPAEQIHQLKKAAAVYDMLYEDGDYGFYFCNMSDIAHWIANRYARLGEFDKATEYYESGMAYARKYDELPKRSECTSFLACGIIQDQSEISANSEENKVASELAYLRQPEIYDRVKNLPEFQAILAKYEPLAGKRKDYGAE